MKTAKMIIIKKLVGSALVLAATLTPLSAYAGMWSAVAMDCTAASANGTGAVSNSALLDKLDFGAGGGVSFKGSNFGWVLLRCNVTTGDDTFSVGEMGITFVDEHGSPNATSQGPYAGVGALAAQLFKMNNATGVRTSVAVMSSNDARTRFTSSAQQLITDVGGCAGITLDFTRNSYYVELTISRTATVVNPKILSVQLFENGCIF